MAEIHNYTMNFSFGHPSKKHLGLTSLRELACTEVHDARLTASACLQGGEL